jgi:1-deoxy-D-xylulose-5-phosphate reductoisomerase
MIPGHVAVLGSTGSIGRSTLDVIRRFPGRFQAVALTAGRNVNLLAEQVREFDPEIVCLGGEAEAAAYRRLAPPKSRTQVYWGAEGLERAACLPSAETVVTALVGSAGLAPTLAAIRAGKRIALANKETLVAGGPVILDEARRRQVDIIPVDSEHSAVFQALAAGRRQDLERIILTASGGPFRDHPRQALEHVTRDQVLNHPTWDMGAKITVDSATLMNKGLEAIEARWLFDWPLDQVAIKIHPQSIVHSMVEFKDGSVIAQMGPPDMRLPIAYALSHPERLDLGIQRLDPVHYPDLTFQDPDLERFPCLKLALEAGRRGGLAPAVLNAANEIAVGGFLGGRIAYNKIYAVVAEVMERVDDLTDGLSDREIDSVLAADQRARTAAEDVIRDVT